MHPSRIFDKPLGFGVVYPPLRVVGILPDYVVGQAYEGRLDIIDNIGDCTVELLDNDLPPGATVAVDNLNMQVVVKWPAYSPPATEHPGIINWDFEAGDLTGWRDLRGGSWDVYVYDRNTPGAKDIPYMPPDGNHAARMEGVGRGDHTLESIPYPATPGQPVMATSLWYQGPSNKDNNNLWTAIVFYGPGGQSQEVRGDRIHDRTNKRRHSSTVNTTTPAWAETKAVRLIAHRRNGRNRLINVDDVQTSGFMYPTGTPPTSDDFYLTVKVTDSANRVAYWTGIISTNSVWLTSAPYPIIAVDSVATDGLVRDARTLKEFADNMVSSSEVIGIELLETLAYKYYDHPGSAEEAVYSNSRVAGIAVVATVAYKSYNIPPGTEEAVSTNSRAVGITLTVTTAYVGYDPEPEAVSTNSRVVGVTLT